MDMRSLFEGNLSLIIVLIIGPHSESPTLCVWMNQSVGAGGGWTRGSAKCSIFKASYLYAVNICQVQTTFKEQCWRECKKTQVLDFAFSLFTPRRNGMM